MRAPIAAILIAGALAAGCGGGGEDTSAADSDGSGSTLFVQTAEGGGFTGSGRT